VKVAKISAPAIRASEQGLSVLAKLWEQVNDCHFAVEFDFSTCSFLSHTGIAFLGGLARLCVFRNGSCTFAWSTMRSPIRRNIEENGFHAAIQNKAGGRNGNSIPYREDRNLDAENLVAFLRDRWLGRDWMNISQRACDTIIGKVLEIYLNAAEHAESPVGIFTCGQHYPKTRQLHLAVVDFGVGIPCKVRHHLKLPTMKPCAAMAWAFRPGTSTSGGSIGRGMGLEMLRQLINLKQGELSVRSHNGHAIITEGPSAFSAVPNPFGGTIVNIKLICDDRHYCLESEMARLADGNVF
jgi:hypothetical protein